MNETENKKNSFIARSRKKSKKKSISTSQQRQKIYLSSIESFFKKLDQNVKSNFPNLQRRLSQKELEKNEQIAQLSQKIDFLKQQIIKK